MRTDEKVYVFFGLIASGKSLLASSWSDKHRFPYFNSDVERKRMAGLDPKEKCAAPLAAGIYTASYNRRTYERLIAAATIALRDRHAGSVVLDGSYQNRDERTRIIAALAPVSVIFIYCYCSESVTKQRLKERRVDPGAVSDGTLEIYYQQKERFDEPGDSEEEVFKLNTDAPVEKLIEILDREFINKKGGSP